MLYVAYFGHVLTLNDLISLFSRFGEIKSIELIKSEEKGKRFNGAFVEMSRPDDARAAMSGLNGKQSNSRTLTILPALPRGGMKARRVGH